MFLSLNFVVEHTAHVGHQSPIFVQKFVVQKTEICRSGAARTREEILGSSSGRPSAQLLARRSVRPRGRGGTSGARRAATDGRAAGSVSDQEVGEARSGKGSREVVLNTFLIFRGRSGSSTRRINRSDHGDLPQVCRALGKRHAKAHEVSEVRSPLSRHGLRRAIRLLPGDRHASGRLPQGPGPVSDSELVFVVNPS